MSNLPDARAKASAAVAGTPASDRQIRYARDLGLSFPPDVTSQEISDLIEYHLDAPRPAAVQTAARALGLEPDGMAGRVLDRRLDERKLAQRWVYSVCRHALKAEWLDFADSGIPPAATVPVVSALVSDRSLVEAIQATGDGGQPFRFWDACCKRGREGSPWFFFGHGGASPRSKLYARTRNLIETLMPGRLPPAPK